MIPEVPRPICATAGCRNAATEEVRVTKPGHPDWQETVCPRCAAYMEANCRWLGYRAERLERTLFVVL